MPDAKPIKPPLRIEIDAVLSWCAAAVNRCRTAWPGKTYEEGVRDCIRWMQGRGERPDQA